MTVSPDAEISRTAALEQYFATGAIDRRPCEAVIDHLESVGPIIVEAVGVGVFIKRARTFAELRPRRRGAMLSLIKSRRPDHPRIVKTMEAVGRRSVVYVQLEGVEDVDDTLREWLTEAYLESPI